MVPAWGGGGGGGGTVGGGPRSMSSDVEGIPWVLSGRSLPDEVREEGMVGSMCMLEGRDDGLVEFVSRKLDCTLS